MMPSDVAARRSQLIQCGKATDALLCPKLGDIKRKRQGRPTSAADYDNREAGIWIGAVSPPSQEIEATKFAVASSNIIVEVRSPCALPLPSCSASAEVPCGNAEPALLIRSISSNSSLVERPSRSSFVTTTISPGISLAMSLANCGRSSPGSAHLLLVDPLGAGRLQGLDLATQIQSLSAHSGVSDDGHFRLQFRKQDTKNVGH